MLASDDDDDEAAWLFGPRYIPRRPEDRAMSLKPGSGWDTASRVAARNAFYGGEIEFLVYQIELGHYDDLAAYERYQVKNAEGKVISVKLCCGECEENAFVRTPASTGGLNVQEKGKIRSFHGLVKAVVPVNGTYACCNPGCEAVKAVLRAREINLPVNGSMKEKSDYIWKNGCSVRFSPMSAKYQATLPPAVQLSFPEMELNKGGCLQDLQNHLLSTDSDLATAERSVRRHYAEGEVRLLEKYIEFAMREGCAELEAYDWEPVAPPGSIQEGLNMPMRHGDL
jgi:hypothetical protein